MKKRSVNPAMAMMAARAMRLPTAPNPMASAGAAQNMMAPPAMPGMKKGGKVHDDIAEDKKLIKKAITQHDEQLHGGKKTTLKLAKGGSASSRADGIAQKGKTKGKWC